MPPLTNDRAGRTALAVATGAMIGAGLRHLVNELIEWDGTGWPWATFLVNVVGCVAIAIAAVSLDPSSDRWAFVATGALGGLTTMSLFVAEVRELWVTDQHATAVGYLTVTLVVTIAAVDVIRRRVRPGRRRAA